MLQRKFKLSLPVTCSQGDGQTVTRQCSKCTKESKHLTSAKRKMLLWLEVGRNLNPFLMLYYVCDTVCAFSGCNINWVSEVTRDYFGSALLRSVIGLENSCHALNQSDAKRKLKVTWSPVFSRAFGSLPVFILSLHWLLMAQTFVMTGCSDYLVLFYDNQLEIALCLVQT